MILSVIAISAIIFFGYYKINSTNYKNLVDEFRNNISQNSGYDISYESIDISKFPFPRISIKHTIVGNGIVIDKIDVSFNVYDILLGNKIPRIKIGNIYINPTKTNNNLSDYNYLISKINKITEQAKEIYIDNLWDTFIRNKIIASNINIRKSLSSLTFSMKIDNEIHFIDTISFKEENKHQSNIKLFNDNFNLKINRATNNSITTSGEFELYTNNIAKFSYDISSYFNFFLNNNIKSEKSLSIKGMISQTDEGKLELANISIKNDFINGAGLFQFENKQTGQSLISLKFTQFDLNELTVGNLKNNYISSNAAYAIDQNPIRVIIDADEINYMGDKIHNFKLDGSSDGTKLNILRCDGDLSSGGNITLSGHLESNEHRSKYIGKITLNHPDLNKFLENSKYSDLRTNTVLPFYFNSDLMATPIDFRMDNFNLSILGQNIKGSTDLKIIGGENILTGNIDFEDLNIIETHIPGVEKLYNYIVSFSENMSEKEDYREKFIPLRTFPLKSTLSLNFDRLNIPNIFFNRFNIVSSFEAGKLDIEDFLMVSNNSSIRGSARILAKSLRPQFRINFTEGDIDLSWLNEEHIENIINFASNNIDFQQIDFTSDGFLNKIKLPFTKLNSLSWSANDKSGALTIEKSNFNIFGGSASFASNIILKPFKISAAYGIDSFKITEFAKSLNLENFPINSGLASANGQYTSTGNSVRSLSSNNYIKGQFIAKDVEFNNFAVDKLIENLSQANITDDIINFSLSKSFEGSSIFNKLEGLYSLNNQIFEMSDLSFLTKYSSGGSGLAMNIYNKNMDFKTIISFYPLGVKIFNPSITPPVKIELLAKGNFMSPDTKIQLRSQNDILQLKSLLKGSRFSDND